MKCPTCQFENEAMKFCVEGGNRLEFICPNCSFSNSPSFSFCGACGQGLASASQALPRAHPSHGKIATVQKYLSKGLTEKVRFQREKMEGKHKQVTVMFCDMKGFTPLVEKLGSCQEILQGG